MRWIPVMAVAAAVLISALPLPMPLRVPAGVALALVLPGHAVTAACDPRRRVRGLEGALIVLAVSLAVTIGVGVALGAAGRLERGTMAVGLGFVALLGYLIAHDRGWRPRRPVAVSRPGPRTLVPWALVALALGATVAIGSRPLAEPLDSGYTTLSMLRDASGGTATIAVRNREGHDQEYLLRISGPGGAVLTARAQRFTVAAGETFERKLAGPFGRRRVVATLSLAERPNEAYRRVSFAPQIRGPLKFDPAIP